METMTNTDQMIADFRDAKKRFSLPILKGFDLFKMIIINFIIISLKVSKI